MKQWAVEIAKNEHAPGIDLRCDVLTPILYRHECRFSFEDKTPLSMSCAA